MAGTLLGGEEQTLSGVGKRQKYSLLGSYGSGDGGNVTERNADAIDTARGAGVSPTFNDFAKSISIGTTPMGATGPLSTGLMGAMALSGNMSMPNNSNQNAGWNEAFNNALAQVVKDYPGMPGSFHGSIAAQRAAKALDAQKRTNNLDAVGIGGNPNDKMGDGGNKGGNGANRSRERDNTTGSDRGGGTGGRRVQ